MVPWIEIAGHPISTYSLMIVVGILAVVAYFARCEKAFPVPAADAELAILYGGIGAFVGSKILYLLTVWPDFLSDLSAIRTEPTAFLTAYVFSGFVFYGGFYGGLLAVIVYTRREHLSFWEMARCLMPAVPLFHVFGRIGCYLAGCCYGVLFVPVQLLEAAGEFLLFVLIFRLSKRPGSGRSCLTLWLIGYGILRFILEFFRADESRGFIGLVSVSQVIALSSLFLGGILLATGRAKREKEVPE